MAFNKKTRQRYINEYLAATRRNIFVAGEFVDWLAKKPDHDLYKAFFGRSDEHDAREYRIGLARRLASGLRIVVSENVMDKKGRVISITSREYPAYVSPAAHRRDGGGYQPFDPLNPEMMAELRTQGATALRSWLIRYRGAFQTAGVDLSAIENIAATATAEAAAV